MSNLPQSAARYGLPSGDYLRLMTEALPLLAGRREEVSEQEKEELAHRSGVPATQRPLADIAELYGECLRFAHAQIWPELDENLDAVMDEELYTLTPVNALRHLVSTTFHRFHQHPAEVAFIVADNVGRRESKEIPTVELEQSPVILQLDRVLMRGHDIGAFRYGVSAEDLYVIIVALCSFPVAHGPAFHALYGMNASDEANRQGMSKLTEDAVLAFLTTTMPTSQGSSYTHSSQTHTSSVGLPSSVAASLYATEHHDWE
ncbi:hypothetical protein [Corynebacterium auriscanis]|uniref:hypothetical protein n=1 Tax=Corynebacterium auriscanis TaxID=99807 RepID=UPI002245ECCE|nr:hypothetical protein [Corynebacterium auriscanis]MCX2163346.1 hypothetical protein [Corynebacterium auriscanis]